MSSPNRRLWLALFLLGLGDGLFAYQLTVYLRELGAAPVDIGLFLSLAMVATAASHIPAGLIADRFGTRSVILSGFGLLVFATLVMYLTRSPAVFGLALGLYYFINFVSAPFNAVITQARGTQSVQQAITSVWTGYYFSTTFSPALGGQLSRWIGLRPLFGLATILFIVVWLLLLLPMPTPATAGPKQPEHLSPSFLRNHAYWVQVARRSIILCAMYIGLPFTMNYVKEVRGYGNDVIGLLGSANAAGALLLNLLMGRRSSRQAFLVAQACLALSFLCLLWFAGLPWLVSAFVLRAGWNSAHHLAMAETGQAVPPNQLGFAMGLTETIIGLILACGPWVAGHLYTRSPALPMQVSLVAILIILPTYSRLAHRWLISSGERVTRISKDLPDA
jgi:predicted MFS family arabinose efflux permease